MMKLPEITRLSLFVFFSLAAIGSSFAQPAAPATVAELPGFYWVTFKDKAGTPFSVKKPEAFLSQKALDRRKKTDTPVMAQDLPVNPKYVGQLEKSGATVQYTSRWFNAATVVATAEMSKTLQSLPCVASVTFVGKAPVASVWKNKAPEGAFDAERKAVPIDSLHYGYADQQIKQMNGHSLHALGHRGTGITVAVLDGGFTSADKHYVFDSLRTKNLLIPARDFVDNDWQVCESSSHGMQVLSVMGGNQPGVLVGGAPNAAYVLVKTEDVRSEYRVEECNWIAGLEYADSLGADIVNSSLGYTTFSDKTMDYQYSSLNGTSDASKAAEFATARGMIVVNSAGNEGDSDWKYVGVPADSKGAFSIGAVDSKGKKAGFSSFGPTADGRIKPDVSAAGSRVMSASASSNQLRPASGTSLSAPLVSGMIAALWSAFPEKTNIEIMDAVRKSGSQAYAPDNELGYGIPDFLRAFELLKGKLQEKP
ncbi:MAG: S8 family peptidase [Saprospiraceae bacterium]